MRKIVLAVLAATAAFRSEAVSPAVAAGDLAARLSGRCIRDGAMTAYYEVDGAYFVSGVLASGQAFSRSGRWAADGDRRTLYFEDGDWRRDLLEATPDDKIRFVSDGGVFIGGAPRPKGDIGYLTFCSDA
jgi:hypothetical protein